MGRKNGKIFKLKWRNFQKPNIKGKVTLKHGAGTNSAELMVKKGKQTREGSMPNIDGWKVRRKEDDCDCDDSANNVGGELRKRKYSEKTRWNDALPSLRGRGKVEKKKEVYCYVKLIEIYSSPTSFLLGKLMLTHFNILILQGDTRKTVFWALFCILLRYRRDETLTLLLGVLHCGMAFKRMKLGGEDVA